jgi:dTDP-4-dehydrorhamnose reductase
MRALITGSNGTIGKELKRYLEFNGIEVYAWDRNKTSILEYHVMEEYVQKLNPDIVFHLAIATELTGMDNETWRVNYEWPSELAWICRIHQIKFIFTSTYEVFSDYNVGPFTLDTKPDAFEGFGFEKRMAEERVLYQNPQAIVVRVPWQITNEPNSSGLVSYLEKEMEEYDKIIASNKFYPCCAFIDDTVKELYRISQEYESGKFMIDSNCNLSLYEIANNLKALYNKTWKIIQSDDYSYNQTMSDERCSIKPLNEIFEEKLREIELKSRKKLGILGIKYIDGLAKAYEKLGYKIDTIVDSDMETIQSFAVEHKINNFGTDISLLDRCNQLIISNNEMIDYEFLEKYKDKIIIFSELPYIADEEAFNRYSKIFSQGNYYVLLKFNQLITLRKVYEQIKSGNLGKITNLFIDIGIKNQKSLKENFQDIILKPLSFINLHFDPFYLDYSDYNEEFETIFTHHCNHHQRMNINIFKLWYEGIKIIFRFIGEKGELRVEGKYTEESGWNFKPIQINEINSGQGEKSDNGIEIINLALIEYVKKLEEVIHKENEHQDIYTAEKAMGLYLMFKDLWRNNPCHQANK